MSTPEDIEYDAHNKWNTLADAVDTLLKANPITLMEARNA